MRVDKSWGHEVGLSAEIGLGVELADLNLGDPVSLDADPSGLNVNGPIASGEKKLSGDDHFESDESIRQHQGEIDTIQSIEGERRLEILYGLKVESGRSDICENPACWQTSSALPPISEVLG